MSPHEMTDYRNAFDAAAAKFGWSFRMVEVFHERDDQPARFEKVWFSSMGERLFSEDELTEGLVKAFIRIAG